MALIKSELRKVIYARANWGILIAGIAISVVSVVTTPFIYEAAQLGPAFGVNTVDGVDGVFANAISGYIFVIILGIMLMAGEYRHGTAAATFLTSPKREFVLFAKLGVAALVGALFMLITAWLSILAGVITLASFEEAVSPSSDLFLNLTLAALVSGVVFGVIGVSVGALLKNQMLAIVFALIYLFVIDPLLLVLFSDVGKFLPGGLITGMLAIDVQAPEFGFDTSSYLQPIPAMLLLLGYGLVFSAISLFTSMKRDVE
jgi:ABC-type transport system involved in multi-copper enzyme maturation permease subunit